MRILIVEDDHDIADLLAEALRNEGWRPMVRHRGDEGLDTAREHSFALILLDLMLPGLSGMEVCRTLRREGAETPILMLTAKDEIKDRVEGLDTGADDYLVKPFSLEELKARIRALTRREAHHKSGLIQTGDLIIDSVKQTATRGGVPLTLTPREFSLLEALAKHEGQVLTREAILSRVWNTDSALPNTVSFHMASLRKKLDATPGHSLIQTVHGLGYVLRGSAP